MNRSVVLLSAFVFTSTALLSLQPKQARAGDISFNCFERSSETLIARSAFDMTSNTISCLPFADKTPSGETGDSFLKIMGFHTTEEDEDYFIPLEDETSGLGKQISDRMDDKDQWETDCPIPDSINLTNVDFLDKLLLKY